MNRRPKIRRVALAIATAGAGLLLYRVFTAGLDSRRFAAAIEAERAAMRSLNLPVTAADQQAAEGNSDVAQALERVSLALLDVLSRDPGRYMTLMNEVHHPTPPGTPLAAERAQVLAAFNRDAAALLPEARTLLRDARGLQDVRYASVLSLVFAASAVGYAETGDAEKCLASLDGLFDLLRVANEFAPVSDNRVMDDFRVLSRALAACAPPAETLARWRAIACVPELLTPLELSSSFVGLPEAHARELEELSRGWQETLWPQGSSFGLSPEKMFAVLLLRLEGVPKAYTHAQLRLIRRMAESGGARGADTSTVLRLLDEEGAPPPILMSEHFTSFHFLVRRAQVRRAAWRSLICVALAAEAYERAEGRAPATLEALQAGYLDLGAVDPALWEGLRYSRVSLGYEVAYTPADAAAPEGAVSLLIPEGPARGR